MSISYVWYKLGFELWLDSVEGFIHDEDVAWYCTGSYYLYYSALALCKVSHWYGEGLCRKELKEFLSYSFAEYLFADHCNVGDGVKALYESVILEYNSGVNKWIFVVSKEANLTFIWCIKLEDQAHQCGLATAWLPGYYIGMFILYVQIKVLKYPFLPKGLGNVFYLDYQCLIP